MQLLPLLDQLGVAAGLAQPREESSHLLGDEGTEGGRRWPAGLVQAREESGGATGLVGQRRRVA